MFTVEMEELLISCSSPRCIQWLLWHGWTLADPSQSDDLMVQLAALDAAASFEPGTLYPLHPNSEEREEHSPAGGVLVGQ